MALYNGVCAYCGYPIGTYYLTARLEARERGINIFSSEFQNNRSLFLDLGVPENRLVSVTPYIITTRLLSEYAGIPVDVLNGHNIPPILDAKK